MAAIETPPTAGVVLESTYSPPPPQSPSTVRKASIGRWQSPRAPPPVPIFADKGHELRGFNPSPIHVASHVVNVTASSEHAFAPKEESKRKPFKPPLGVYTTGVAEQSNTVAAQPLRSNPGDGSPLQAPSSPIVTPPSTPRRPKLKGLRSTRSVGEGLRGLRERFASGNQRKISTSTNEETRSSVPVHSEIRSPVLIQDEVRTSVPVQSDARSSISPLDGDHPTAVTPWPSQSPITNASSALHRSTTPTEQSSITRTSSHTSEFVQVYPHWPKTDPEVDEEEELTVEDAIGMYADGFEDSARPSIETERRSSKIAEKTAPDPDTGQDARPTSQHSEHQIENKRVKLAHRRSQSASLLLAVPKRDGDAPRLLRSTDRTHTFSRILSSPANIKSNGSIRDSTHGANEVPRDRYGFKKSSLHVTLEEYDAWDAEYSIYLERRRKKWDALMRDYGLFTENPYRFPPKSDKIKRYVRKGIPPAYRGAAWFWYAGGPSKMKKEPGLYSACLEKVKSGLLGDSDREHIERDLHRTFPDNVRFKPDPVMGKEADTDVAGERDRDSRIRRSHRSSFEVETPMLQALRRVLQAFAVHNPHIGYCQSLNFIAGLLLLFLNEDEEKAFILLNIVTTEHLPGTHGVALEGANIDIAVLMTCVQDSLPAIWQRLDDNGGPLLASTAMPGAQALRLPTVSLATTAWFMSLFVGTLPIESVLRIWDCLFFEGSKTLFRIALAILKFGEPQILAVGDHIEIFQVVQAIPRSMLDINELMEVCFRRRGGFGHVSQGLIETRRQERRQAVADGVASVNKDARMSVWKGRWRARTKA